MSVIRTRKRSVSPVSRKNVENIGIDNIPMEEVIGILNQTKKEVKEDKKENEKKDDEDENKKDEDKKEDEKNSKCDKCVKIIYSLFIEHPASVNMNYFEHFMRGMSLAFQTGVATCALLVHSVVPKFFPSAGSSIIMSLAKEIEEFKKKSQ